MTAGEWRVSGKPMLIKSAAAVIFLIIAALSFRDPVAVLLALVCAVGLAVFAARDVLAPVRLAADVDGVTVVTGYAGRRRIPWTDVERVRVDVRDRLGMRQEFLEIDTGATLHLFSAGDLGSDPHDVASALASIRTGR